MSQHKGVEFFLNYSFEDQRWLCKVSEPLLVTHGDTADLAYKAGVDAYRLMLEMEKNEQ